MRAKFRPSWASIGKISRTLSRTKAPSKPGTAIITRARAAKNWSLRRLGSWSRTSWMRLRRRDCLASCPSDQKSLNWALMRCVARCRGSSTRISNAASSGATIDSEPQAAKRYLQKWSKKPWQVFCCILNMTSKYAIRSWALSTAWARWWLQATSTWSSSKSASLLAYSAITSCKKPESPPNNNWLAQENQTKVARVPSGRRIWQCPEINWSIPRRKKTSMRTNLLRCPNIG